MEHLIQYLVRDYGAREYASKNLMPQQSHDPELDHSLLSKPFRKCWNFSYASTGHCNERNSGHGTTTLTKTHVEI
jgi:hypothetical protein